MTEEEALALLTRITDAAVEPVLTEDDLDDLLAVAARPDDDELTRADAAWTPTWDINAGAAAGWNRKAAKAAGRYSFAEDGQRFDRAQVYAHCVEMERNFTRKGMGTAQVDATLSG